VHEDRSSVPVARMTPRGEETRKAIRKGVRRVDETSGTGSTGDRVNRVCSGSCSFYIRVKLHPGQTGLGSFLSNQGGEQCVTVFLLSRMSKR
jgi:hypothetical protein